MRESSEGEESCSKFSGLNLKPASQIKTPKGACEVSSRMDAAREHQLLKMFSVPKERRVGKQPENLKISLCQKHKGMGEKEKAVPHNNTRHLWTYSLKMWAGGCSESTASSMQERGNRQGLCR